MKVGLVGLGRMGAAIGQRLNERGCEVVAWDRDPKARELQGKRGLRVLNGPQAVADAITKPYLLSTCSSSLSIFGSIIGVLPRSPWRPASRTPAPQLPALCCHSRSHARTRRRQ